MAIFFFWEFAKFDKPASCCPAGLRTELSNDIDSASDVGWWPRHEVHCRRFVYWLKWNRIAANRFGAPIVHFPFLDVHVSEGPVCNPSHSEFSPNCWKSQRGFGTCCTYPGWGDISCLSMMAQSRITTSMVKPKRIPKRATTIPGINDSRLRYVVLQMLPTAIELYPSVQQSHTLVSCQTYGDETQKFRTQMRKKSVREWNRPPINPHGDSRLNSKTFFTRRSMLAVDVRSPFLEAFTLVSRAMVAFLRT